MSDPGLETFKTGIDLRVYAAGQGYALDQRESWRGCSVMRSADGGDKIIIKRDDDGPLRVFFSAARRRQRLDYRFHTAAPARRTGRYSEPPGGNRRVAPHDATRS
jgi:hypothetical protein